MNNHNKRKKTITLKVMMVLFVLFGSVIPTVGLAEKGELKFHIQPQFPESQLEGSESYFDLNLAPGQTEFLELVIQNDTEEPVEIQVTAHTAYTNVNGVVEYGKDADESDPTLIHSLDELIETPNPILLLGKEKQTIQLPLNMPEESFEGVLSGGIRVQEVPQEVEDEGEKEEGLAIKNEFSYIVGVVVSNSRSSIAPDLELLNVFADQLNYRNVFSATIQNYLPTFVNRIEIDAAIREKGKEEVLYTAEQTGIQMAPNSHFNFPISLNGDRFQSGDYILTMTAKSGGEEWEWEQEFSVDANEARRLNREDVTIDSSINWWIIASVVLVALLIGVIGYLVYQKKKAYQKKQERMERKLEAKKGVKKNKSS